MEPTETTWAERPRLVRVLLHLPNFVRLYWRLLRDRRVPIRAKALLWGAFAYIVMPFDLVPDVLLTFGRLDDLIVLIVAARWFILWSPPEVVREHARAIDVERSRPRSGAWR